MKEDPDFNSAKVYELARAGDPSSQEIFRRVGTALGIALADLINIFNLPIYVIGGGAAASWDAFAPTMLEEVRKYSYIYRVTAPPADLQGDGRDLDATQKSAGPAKLTRIVRAALGGDAGLIGAARLVFISVASRPGQKEGALSQP
jgi:glucokinase